MSYMLYVITMRTGRYNMHQSYVQNFPKRKIYDLGARILLLVVYDLLPRGVGRMYSLGARSPPVSDKWLPRQDGRLCGLDTRSPPAADKWLPGQAGCTSSTGGG